MSEAAVASTSGSSGVAVERCNDLTIVAGHAALLRAHGLGSLDALFGVADAERLSKPGLSPWRERLRLTLRDAHGPRIFYLKRFFRPPAAARRALRLGRAGAISLAAVEWAWMHRLAQAGIACARPVAMGEELDGSRELRSAILTAAVPGRSLEAWAQTWRDADRPTVRRLLAPLAALVARLHQLGYVHRDLYLSHVFWDPTAPLETSLHLIDLQRIMRPRWRRERWIIKDLAALNFSAPSGLVPAAYRLRWLKHYLNVPKLDAAAKRLGYRVIGKTLGIAQHQERRGARL